MSELKYLIYRTVTKRKTMMDNIRHQVLRDGLGMEIPLVRFERGGGRGEYYLGIAVSVDDPAQLMPSSKVLEMLNNVGLTLFVRTEKGAALWESRKITFLQGNFDWESFNHPIAFEPSPSVSVDADCFERTDQITTIEQELAPDDEECMDKLLWWCSAKGEGSFQGFKEVCELLKSVLHFHGTPRQAMRSLILLGYIESINEGRKWGCTPTAFVQPSIGDAYLTGKLTSALLKRFTEQINITKTGSNGGPSRFVPIDIVGAGLPILDNPAGKLADVLSCFKEWQDTLDVDPDIQPHQYSFKIYNGTDFVVPSERGLKPGLYEATRLDGHYPVPTTTFYDGSNWVRGGFYDLKWLAIKNSGKPMNVRINKEGSLGVPIFARWPLLYERPLVLASGKLPRKINIDGIDALVYESVGLDIAGVLAEKLEVKIEEV